MSRKVFFDVDPGCDDAVMLAVALGLDDIDVVGLSTVCGNTTVENTTRNALSILALGGDDVPVARGCARPLVDDLTVAEWVHGPDGIRGDMPEPTAEPIDTHGAQFMVQQAREHGEELTIAAVGPLTNLAVALSIEPALPDIVDDIYVMGGSAFALGNVTPASEANFYNDPAAASRVVQDAGPTMVGLDVTTRATVSSVLGSEFRAAEGALGVVGDWLDYPEGVLDVAGGTIAIHDAAVVAALADPSVLTFEPYYCEIDTTGGPSHGSVVCDGNRVLDEQPNVDVAVAIDTERYRELLGEGIRGYVA